MNILQRGEFELYIGSSEEDASANNIGSRAQQMIVGEKFLYIVFADLAKDEQRLLGNYKDNNLYLAWRRNNPNSIGNPNLFDEFDDLTRFSYSGSMWTAINGETIENPIVAIRYIKHSDAS